jgi:hypothetical protein
MKNQVPIYKPEENPGFIPDAIYRSTTPIVEIPASANGTTVQVLDNSFNDDVAQYMKGDNAELLRIRNQAYNAVGPDVDNANPPLIGRQDSDPKGG